MFITGIGTAVPPRQFSQLECWSSGKSNPLFHRLSPRSQAIVKRVLLGNNGIATRHLVVDSIDELFDISPGTLHARFATHAPALASRAGLCALQSSRLQASDIDAVIISTCTGYLCPGLTSYVIESLGLRRDAIALDLVGQGCGAALPNLSTGQALLAASRARHVLCICVEICSAAFYVDDDPGVLISACLFGDAAGAIVLSKEPGGLLRTVEWKTGRSLTDPALRDSLRFELKDGMLRNILAREVPALAAEKAEHMLKQVLHDTGVHKKEIAVWILHGGGRDVLSAIGERLKLPADALADSAEILRERGNISSPFVIHVLERALARNAPNGYWWMSSFGAGFSCHGALLEVR